MKNDTRVGLAVKIEYQFVTKYNYCILVFYTIHDTQTLVLGSVCLSLPFCYVVYSSNKIFEASLLPVKCITTSIYASI